jgi:predicted nucleotidyltransferase
MDVNFYLDKLSKTLGLPDSERRKIEISIDTLKRKIWAHYQNKLQDVIVFGSYDRGTILRRDVDEESDVDILVIHKTGQLQPQTYLLQLKEFANNNYRSEASQDHPTIAFELEHIRFEIVPAYDNDDWFIPAPRTKDVKWIVTDPIGFKEKLKVKSQNNYQLIIPMILIFKYWNVLNDRVFSSYELEKIIVTTTYYNCETLRHYFFDIIDALDDLRLSEQQREKVAELKNRTRRLKIMEDESMQDLIENELMQFIPLTS